MEQEEKAQDENVTKVSLKAQDLETITKVDLSKPPKKEEDADQKQEATEVVADEQAGALQEVVEEVSSEQTSVQDEEPAVVEEITDEETNDKLEEVKEEIEEVIAEAEATGKPLPESIEKLMQFMDETGGDLKDYVKLNQNYDEMDNLTTLQEYYKITKPHLDTEERKFLMDETFSFDEEVDDPKDIRKKKIALKEQVAEAKAYLDGQKSKYYEEIKAGSKLTGEQQKAIDFFNRYNKESEQSKKRFDQVQNIFNKKTDNVFSDKFKGFEYNIGEKRFRFNVKDTKSVKQAQGDLNNFVQKFLNEKGEMDDAAGYHKSLYTAMNSDAIAQHFYEQGKADALKESVAKAKNLSMDPRQTHKEVQVGGTKYRILDGSSANDYKVKMKKGRK